MTSQAIRTKIYALVGALGGVTFAGAFLLGTGVTLTLGIPIASASVNGFWVGMVIAASVFVLRDYRFVATTMMLIYGLGATVTPLLGPPGIHKVLIAVIMGLLWDTSYRLFPKLTGQILGAVLFIAASFPMIILAMHLQGSPAVDKLIMATPILLPVSITTAVLGSIVGHRVLGPRLDRLPVLHRILGKT